VFHPESRQYYNLESMMDGAPCIYPPAVAAVQKAVKASPKVATATIFESAPGSSPERAERVAKTRRRRQP
jgi:hypothetical protein